jgi:hypothetical protein
MSNKYKYECNNDCFHCEWPDCIKNGVSREERKTQNTLDECISSGGYPARVIRRSNKRRRYHHE